MTTVARFEVALTRYLDEHGNVLAPLPAPYDEPRSLIPFYRGIVLTRTFDARAVALQRTGQLGTFASSLGQEAVGAVVGALMRPEDVLLPTYREAAAQLARGVTMVELFRYWSGDEEGSNFAGPRQDFPVCITIAAQCCHAVGAAMAFRLRREPRVAVCVQGDGATSKGDFYEALNAAGAWKLPVVFIVINNHWAISLPRTAQTAALTLAQKAIAAGIPGEQADGNDAVAVADVFGRQLQAARDGQGPALLEALTYRLHDHTTADDARRYRSDEEVRRAWAHEPVVRLRSYLARAGVWSKDDEETLLAQCNARVQAAVEAYQKLPPPAPAAMFDHLYATLPAAYAGQRADLERGGSGHG
ncbi:MAG: pyruvate dehydrogenase (acetyl-transferring) E1 component subunit alpha [Pseudomonadota bacterium]